MAKQTSQPARDPQEGLRLLEAECLGVAQPTPLWQPFCLIAACAFKLIASAHEDMQATMAKAKRDMLKLTHSIL